MAVANRADVRFERRLSTAPQFQHLESSPIDESDHGIATKGNGARNRDAACGGGTRFRFVLDRMQASIRTQVRDGMCGT